MLVNESTLRAVVRKYLLKEITLDSVASGVGNTATTVLPWVGPWANSTMDAKTRRSARQNFMVVNPLGGENSPSAMTQNATDGGITPQQKIEHLYNYVNNNNINAVYLAIIKILKNHADDLDAEENEIEKLYGKALFTSLINAAGSSFTSAQPLPKETAASLGLPIAPAGPNDVAIVAQLTAQRDKALAQADARSLPNALQAFLDFTTSPQRAFATYDYSKLNNARQGAAQPGATVDSIAALLAGAAILSIDKIKFQEFATKYLKTFADAGIEQANKWAENYILTTDLLKSGTAPTAAPAASPAAPAPAPAAKPKPKPAGNWDSYVKMTKGGQGAAVKQAWESNAARLGSDISYYSFVSWYRTQMKTSGHHLSPSEIISLLRGPTPAAAAPAAAPAAATAAASPPPAAPTPAASAATGTPPSSRRTDWIRNRADKSDARSSTLNKKANRIDKRKAKKQ